MRVSVRLVVAISLAGLVAAGGWAWRQRQPVSGTAPAVLACWPWPDAEPTPCWPGVRMWLAWSGRDGTQARLIEFDFATRPTLRLELYDQDQDDAEPLDNHADISRSVLGVARDLQFDQPGTIVAAWNGLFYALGPDRSASHVAPVVLDGQVHYNVGNHRWTVGARRRHGVTEFLSWHLPDKATLAAEFDVAAAGAQMLLRDGEALHVQPPPQPGDPPLVPPISSTPADAGHIPEVDHRYCPRTSMAWPADSSRLWLLIIEDIRAQTGAELRGGWALADLQRFWQAFGAANAANLDGGPETQLLVAQPSGNYLLLPSAKSGRAMTMIRGLDREPDPGGGSLMTFYVRDTAEDGS